MIGSDQGRVAVLAVICILTLGCWAAWAQAPDLSTMDIVEKSVPDGPVAKVGEASISRKTFLDFYGHRRDEVNGQRSAGEMPDGARVQLAMWCLGNLIEEELLYLDAQHRGLVAKDEGLVRAWQSDVDQYRNILSQRDGKELTDDDVIKAMGYANKDEAMSDLKRSILIRMARMEVISESDLDVSQEELEKYYAENRERFVRDAGMKVRRILVQAPGEDSKLREDGKVRIEKAMKAIMTGKRFENVAKESSDGQERDNGGNIGFVPLDGFPPFYLEALETMEPGDVSDIIESPNGFHIVQLIERVSEGEASLEEAAKSIRLELQRENSQQTIRDHCDSLIQGGIQVVVLLELEKNLFLSGADEGLPLN